LLDIAALNIVHICNQRNQMKRYVLALDLKDDVTLIQEYEEYHRAVWPEVEEVSNPTSTYACGTAYFWTRDVCCRSGDDRLFHCAALNLPAVGH
jgi:L-rhamnose mutarotase